MNMKKNSSKGKDSAEKTENIQNEELAGYSFRPVPDEEIQALVHHKTPLAKKIILYAIVLAFLLGFTYMVCDVRGINHKNQIEMLSKGNKTIVLWNGERLDSSISGDIVRTVESQDVTSVIALTEDNELYLITKKGIEKISKDCENAKISMNGRFVLFSENDSVFLYNIKKDKSEKIDEDVDMDTAVLSPDGKSVAYNKNGESILYLRNDSETKEVDSGVRCIGISNDARYMYSVEYYAEPIAPEEEYEKPNASDYDEYDEYKEAYDNYSKYYDEYNEKLEEYESFDYEDVSLYYYKSAQNSNRKKIDDLNELSSVISYYFNENFSQLVYTNDGKTFYSKKGESGEKISKSMIVPAEINSASSDFFDYTGEAVVLYEDSLLNREYYGDALYYVDRKGNADKIDNNISSYELSADGTKVCYIDINGRFYISDTQTGDDRNRLVKDVRCFTAEDNFSEFYCIDNENNLWYVKDNGRKERIDRDVDTISKAPDGGVYYISDDVLYLANGSDRKRITKNVDEIYSGERFALYIKSTSKSSDNANIFVSKDGDEKFNDKYKGYSLVSSNGIGIVDSSLKDSYDYDDDYDYGSIYDDYDYSDSDSSNEFLYFKF